MKKVWISLVLLIFLFPVRMEAETEQLQAAFVRDHALWMYIDGSEVLLQENLSISNLSWSFDGQWLAFEAAKDEEESDIWLYHVPTNKHIKLKMKGHGIQWNPNVNTLAFLTDSFLSVVEIKSMKPIIHQLTGGVSHFSWDADGSNLITSASAVLFPDGWSHPRLYVVNWMLEKKKQELDVKVEPLHTISSPLKYEDVSIISIDAEHFTWSRDGKLMAFVVSPTASWSADSNMLSVFVKENKILIPMGETLLQKGWFKWAPTKSVLASIQGGGRLTLGVKNKKLVVQKILPNQTKVLTPSGYADVDFDWVDDAKLVVARGKESNELTAFHSYLYLVDVESKNDKKLIDSPEGFSDGQPLYSKANNLITWIREDKNGWKSVWISTVDGTEQRQLIKGVDEVEWFIK